MPYPPPPVTDAEKILLKILAKQPPGAPIESSVLERLAKEAGSFSMDGIAHLVAHGFISYFPERVGCLGAILRLEPRYFAIILPPGVVYLRERGHTSAAEDERDRQLSETPDDRRNAMEEVVRIASDSFRTRPIYDTAKHRDALSRLDPDIIQELQAAEFEQEAMWREFERRFGHRGPASAGPEAELRDPVILTTTVRMFRAMDEQLRRLGLPSSRKPPAWPTHYRNGQVPLPPPPWERTGGMRATSEK